MPTLRRRNLYSELKEGMDELRAMWEREAVHDADFWDIGAEAERPLYMYGVTGLEE